MLEVLHRVEDDLPDLLREGIDAWRSLDIDYEPPQVERLWRPHQCQHRNGADDIRIYLHRIHPCEKALFHPHPWPSAIRIITGRYEMGIGFRRVQTEPPSPPMEVAKLVLGAGDQYEMVDPWGWHYVKPLDEPSLSLMITARPFEVQTFDHSQFGKGVNKPLSPDAAEKLLAEFTEHYHYWRSNR